MKMTNEEYGAYVHAKMPRSPMGTDLLKAFLSGGLICCLGQALIDLWGKWGLDPDSAGTAASVTLVFLGALLTGLGVYDDLAKHCGAGTLVPITGFANSVAAPALEFKAEGFILGTAVKMFFIAGPVLVYGVSASVIYGLLYWLVGRIG